MLHNFYFILQWDIFNIESLHPQEKCINSRNVHFKSTKTKQGVVMRLNLVLLFDLISSVLNANNYSGSLIHNVEKIIQQQLLII
jgi:hypothetical protein